MNSTGKKWAKLAGFLLVAMLSAGVLSGCSQTTVNTEWRDPGYVGPGVRSLVVLCLPADSKEKECEDEFVRQLQEAGISATPGHSTTAAAFSSKKGSMEMAREMGVSMVLVSRFLERRSQLDVYPVQNRSMLLMPDYDMWSDYRLVENQYQVYGTVLYDVSNGKAIWSAESDTFVHTKDKKTLESYVKAMIKKMKKQGLLVTR
jgi:hypothetical protein